MSIFSLFLFILFFFCFTVSWSLGKLNIWHCLFVVLPFRHRHNPPTKSIHGNFSSFLSIFSLLFNEYQYLNVVIRKKRNQEYLKCNNVTWRTSIYCVYILCIWVHRWHVTMVMEPWSKLRCPVVNNRSHNTAEHHRATTTTTATTTTPQSPTSSQQ